MEMTPMANRVFPSFYLYKDAKKEWRWSYEAKNGKTIAVSSESYKNRTDAEHSIEIMKGCYNSPTWMPADLLHAA